jgi:hypothetical protein
MEINPTNRSQVLGPAEYSKYRHTFVTLAATKIAPLSTWIKCVPQYRSLRLVVRHSQLRRRRTRQRRIKSPPVLTGTALKRLTANNRRHRSMDLLLHSIRLDGYRMPISFDRVDSIYNTVEIDKSELLCTLLLLAYMLFQYGS